MAALADGTYDAFIIDVDGDVLELTLTSGEHKGEVVAVRAENLQREFVDLIGTPVSLVVADGRPAVTFD